MISKISDLIYCVQPKLQNKTIHGYITGIFSLNNVKCSWEIVK